MNLEEKDTQDFTPQKLMDILDNLPDAIEYIRTLIENDITVKEDDLTVGDLVEFLAGLPGELKDRSIVSVFKSFQIDYLTLTALQFCRMFPRRTNAISKD